MPYTYCMGPDSSSRYTIYDCSSQADGGDYFWSGTICVSCLKAANSAICGGSSETQKFDWVSSVKEDIIRNKEINGLKKEIEALKKEIEALKKDNEALKNTYAK